MDARVTHDDSPTDHDAKPSMAYWDDYYARRQTPTLPSQFAVFAMNEVPDAGGVVEYGCGIGRDTLFFAGQGSFALGFDASGAAIAKCEAEATRRRFDSVRFEKLQAESPDLCERTLRFLDQRPGPDAPALLYARFFVHAITDDQEHAFTRSVSSVLAEREGVFAVEFRTCRDREQAKATQRHFRRFVDPLEFISRMNALGLEVKYFVEGFGYAKYRSDDAHVARLLLVKR